MTEASSAAAAALIGTPFLTAVSVERGAAQKRFSDPGEGVFDDVVASLLQREPTELVLASSATAEGGSLAQRVDAGLAAVEGRLEALLVLAEEASDQAIGADRRQALADAFEETLKAVTADAQGAVFAEEALLQESRTLFFDTRRAALLDSDQASTLVRAGALDAGARAPLIPLVLIDATSEGLGLSGLSLADTGTAATTAEAVRDALSAITSARTKAASTIVGFQSTGRLLEERRAALTPELASLAEDAKPSRPRSRRQKPYAATAAPPPAPSAPRASDHFCNCCPRGSARP